MDAARLTDLLSHVESDDLDWRFGFPKELDGTLAEEAFEIGQAKMVRAIVALANGAAGGTAHLVYGVHDNGFKRMAIGVKGSWEESTIREWVRELVDPVPRFRYTEVRVASNPLGVFEVWRVPSYPHVITRSVGDVMQEGQVWLRREVKSQVAGYEDLRRMFLGEEPRVFAGEQDSGLVEVVQEIRRQGDEPVEKPLDGREALLADGQRPAYLPGTRREIHLKGSGDRPTQILMVL